MYDMAQTAFTLAQARVGDYQPDIYDFQSFLVFLNEGYRKLQRRLIMNGIKTNVANCDYLLRPNARTLGRGTYYDLQSATSTQSLGANAPSQPSFIGDDSPASALLSGAYMTYVTKAPHKFYDAVPAASITGIVTNQTPDSNFPNVTREGVITFAAGITPSQYGFVAAATGTASANVPTFARVYGFAGGNAVANSVTGNRSSGTVLLGWPVLYVNDASHTITVDMSTATANSPVSPGWVPGTGGAVVKTQMVIVGGVVGNTAANGLYYIADCPGFTPGGAASSTTFRVGSLSQNGDYAGGGVAVLSPSLPGDFLQPVVVWEKLQTDPDSNFLVVQNREVVSPNYIVNPTGPSASANRHSIYSFDGDTINVPPVSLPTWLRIRYYAAFPDIQQETDAILVPWAGTAVAYYGAAEAVGSKGVEAGRATLEAAGDRVVDELLTVKMHGKQMAARPQVPYGANPVTAA